MECALEDETGEKQFLLHENLVGLRAQLGAHPFDDSGTVQKCNSILIHEN